MPRVTLYLNHEQVPVMDQNLATLNVVAYSNGNKQERCSSCESPNSKFLDFTAAA